MAHDDEFPPLFSHNIATLKDFLSPNGEAVFLTRGQSLPNLLQRSRSGRNLARPGMLLDRRDSSMTILRESDDLEAGLQMGGSGEGRLHRRMSKWSGADAEEMERERRTSEGMAALMTPEMRSQRLIGNSNPRYSWYVCRRRGWIGCTN